MEYTSEEDAFKTSASEMGANGWYRNVGFTANYGAAYNSFYNGGGSIDGYQSSAYFYRNAAGQPTVFNGVSGYNVISDSPSYIPEIESDEIIEAIIDKFWNSGIGRDLVPDMLGISFGGIWVEGFGLGGSINVSMYNERKGHWSIHKFNYI